MDSPACIRDPRCHRQEGFSAGEGAAGADPNLTDREGFAALHIASFLGLDEWAARLIAKSAKVDAQKNVLGYPPLLQAAKIKGPYVLVDHSLGGLNMQPFAAK